MSQHVAKCDLISAWAVTAYGALVLVGSWAKTITTKTTTSR